MTLLSPARLYVNTIVKSLSDMEMKAGETYWIFTGQEITQFVFDGYSTNGDILGHIDEHTRFLIMSNEGPIFPTREALCEHYRKIFE